MFGLSEVAVVLIVVIAAVAARKLPGLARSAGKSARILKAEARAMREESRPAGERTPPRVIRGETVTPGAPEPTRPSASGQRGTRA
ncbi:twin-arginine translocase TatA/TatE family subunit [Streptomyces chromofuscus]|uniref:twin-arginine translocase TatA/TatE family subunit n=1 Tax=Streptomyces chromofuscus TaxID=42881 RepID=UPI001672840D|nr:twin-arginine translocase TatA/TatE family subunit [Streptomyces chromofuscus]